MFWKTEDGEVDKRCLFLVLLLTGAIVAGGLYICSPFFEGYRTFCVFFNANGASVYRASLAFIFSEMIFEGGQKVL